jgi:hypothetical protein
LRETDIEAMIPRRAPYSLLTEVIGLATGERVTLMRHAEATAKHARRGASGRPEVAAR